MQCRIPRNSNTFNNSSSLHNSINNSSINSINNSINISLNKDLKLVTFLFKYHPLKRIIHHLLSQIKCFQERNLFPTRSRLLQERRWRHCHRPVQLLLISNTHHTDTVVDRLVDPAEKK